MHGPPRTRIDLALTERKLDAEFRATLLLAEAEGYSEYEALLIAAAAEAGARGLAITTIPGILEVRNPSC